MGHPISLPSLNENTIVCNWYKESLEEYKTDRGKRHSTFFVTRVDIETKTSHVITVGMLKNSLFVEKLFKKLRIECFGEKIHFSFKKLIKISNRPPKLLVPEYFHRNQT